MSETDKHRIPIDLISRVLSGEADSQEINQLELWEQKSGDNKEVLKQYRILWKKSGKLTPYDNINIDKEWNRFKSSRGDGSADIQKVRRFSPFTRLAAAVSIGLIVVFSALFSYNTLKYENVSALVEVIEVSLPDGSLATLYPGSSIKYPKAFGKENRKVKLEGEAFFDVTRDSLRAFSVGAGDMHVKVLGTSFNIEAFKFSDTYNVIVEEGRVSVFSNKNQINTTILTQGEKASFSSSGKEILKTVNEDINFNAWRTSIIVFNDSDLEEIASILSKVYLKEIIVKNKSDDQRLSARFENKSLEYILETIEVTLDIKIDEDEGKILIQ